MSSTTILLWIVIPYLCLTVFVVGHFWRYRYDKFGWTTRSSQLYESAILRWASPLFHFGILVVEILLEQAPQFGILDRVAFVLGKDLQGVH